MTDEVQPLPFKPHRLEGLSDRLLVSHSKRNYGRAARRLDAKQRRLGLSSRSILLPPFRPRLTA